ncbi:MAG: ACP S-malonyltransferase [Legionella sp.]|jgi:[acyl-carrier-protein] S-malonyltransferase
MSNTAFVFPGQGSQTVGMLSDFLPQYPLVYQIFAEASAAIGYDIWHLVQNGPAEALNKTEHTQVVMLTADVAVFELLMQQGVKMPKIMAGHSLGEYSALVAAKALTLTEAVRLVAQRALTMQAAVPLGQGAMAAVVGLTNEQIETLCHEASVANEQVTPANYNAIGQVVVAGHKPAVERLIALADAAGARLAMVIPVSVPCHCPLLTEASKQFASYLAEVDFKTPTVDVVSNVDLSIYKSPVQIREKLEQQLYSPVRWVETIQLFKQRGIELIVECGPGKVLGGLTKRIDKSLNSISVYDTINLDQILEQAD